MVLFTSEKLIFKGSKKRHQILAQTAYYQAGKILVQTILPEQPPVALITLNTLGTTCSTSADTYIPIENIFNTQSCSSLESRLVSLYGGKAASLLIEYKQRLKFLSFLNKNNNSSLNDSSLTHNKSSINPLSFQDIAERMSSGVKSQVNTISPASARIIPSEFFRNFLEAPRIVVKEKHIPFNFNNSGTSKEGLTKQKSSFTPTKMKKYGAILFQRGQKLTKQKIGQRSQAGTETKLINNVARVYPRASHGVRNHVFNFSELTLLPNGTASKWQPNGKARLIKTCFAGAGTNIFQSTLGNIEIQTATRLARIMVNYWNFYSLNKISPYSLVKKYAIAQNSFKVSVHRKTSINSINKLANFSNSSSNDSSSLLRIPLSSYAPLYPEKVRGNQSSATLVPRTVARERILPYKPTIYKASARLKLLRSSSKATLAPPAFYKSRNSKRINNWEGKNSFGIPYPLPSAKQSFAYPERVMGIKGKQFRANDANDSAAYPLPFQGIRSSGVQALRFVRFARGQQLKDHKQKDLSYILKEESVAKELEAGGNTKRKCNVRIWGIKLKVKDKTPQGNIIYKYKMAKRWNNLYFAIAKSKNSLKICENKNSSYNRQRLSIENIGNYSQLNYNNFQLINSLQFSHLQRDRFYPNWFRLYLPDMEATEFLKNIANYYFSLGLQTLTFPSTKSSYFLPSNVTQLPTELLTSPDATLFEKGFLLYPERVKRSRQIHLSGAFGKLNVSTTSPFLSFLNKNIEKEKYKLFIPNISSYTYCPPAILINSSSVKSINSHNKLSENAPHVNSLSRRSSMQNTLTLSALPYPGGVKSFAYPERVRGIQNKWSFSSQSPRKTIWIRSKARDIKDPSFIKVDGARLDPLNVPFSLLLENQIFPLNYNGFSIVEKELLYNTLVNSSFAKAFYLINQNRQLLDFFVDYLLRFQILRQHQILYLFSTLLLSCNKTA